MRRSLIIGIGGTGVSIIQRVQELIAWRHNIRADDVPFVRYIGLDTSLDTMGEEGGDFAHIRVGPEGVRDSVEQYQEGQWRWIDPTIVHAAGAVQDGAGSVRMIGKFSFFYPDNLSRFLDMLDVRVRALAALTSNDVPAAFSGDGSLEGNVKIFVVANTVSGTGSGAFVDVGYLTRRHVISPDYQDIPFEITALVTLPDDLDDKVHAANAYHALKELNHWMGEHPGYEIDDPLHPGREPIRVHRTQRPFDYAYLVSRHRGLAQDPVDNHEYLDDLIGEFIYQDIFLPVAQKRDGRRDDYHRRFIYPDSLGYYPRFSSFGLATIEYPVVQVARGCACRWLIEALNEWLGLAGADSTRGARPWASASYQLAEPPVDETPYLALLAETSLAEGGLRQTGSMLHALSAPTEMEGESVNLVTRYETLVHQAIRSYRGEVGDLDAVVRQIDRGFTRHEFQPGREAGPFPPGIAMHLSERNEAELRSRLPRALTDKSTDLCFGSGSPAPGPFYASTYLEEVRKRLEAIQSRQDSPGESGTATGYREQMDAARAELGEIESDFVLVSPADHFRAIARRGVLEQFRRATIAYFDARFEELLVAAARRIAEELVPVVATLRKRVDNFEEYMHRGVRELLARRYDDAIRPRRVNGYDLLHGEPEKEIERAYQEVDSARDRSGRILQFVRSLRNSRLAEDLAVEPGTKGIFDDSMSMLRNPKARPDEPPYRVRRQHEDAIVTPVRKRFLSSLGQVNVLERFAQEGGRTEDIREVHTLARVFIDAAQADANFDYNAKLMFKRWYAYPGGEQWTDGPPNDPQTHEQEFAKRLSEAVGNVRWAEESVGSESNQMVVFLQERGAFPMRLVRHVNDAMYKAASGPELQTTAQDWDFANPLVSRADVDFMPLDVRDREKLREARNVFLLAVAARVLVPYETVRGFRLADANVGENVIVLPGAPGALGSSLALGSLPRRVNAAALKVYSTPEWRRELSTRLEAYRKATQPIEIVTQISDMLRQPHAWYLDVPSDSEDPLRQYMNASVLWGYVAQETELRKAWEESIAGASDEKGDSLGPSLRQGRPDVLYVDQPGLVGERSYPSQGWYCTICHAWLGNPRTEDGEHDAYSVPMCDNPNH